MLGNSGHDMVKSLIGGKSYFSRDCEWSKIQTGIDMGTLVFTISQIGFSAALPPGTAAVAALGAGGTAGYMAHQQAKC